jgi:signal transduction histidine kinase
MIDGPLAENRAEANVTLLDALSEGVVLVGGGRVRLINREAGRLLAVAPAQAKGAPVIAVLRDHRLERVLLEGSVRELDMHGRRVVAKAIPGGLSLLEVSALRRAQNEARELLAVLSHELRTPVTTIRSSLEALACDLSPAQRQRFLAHAKAETERLVRLLDDLTVEVKPPQLRRLSLAEVSARAVSLLDETFKQHGVTTDVKLPELTVLADSDKLLQILINLLENAAIHGPDNKTIHLCARRSGTGGFVDIVVQDEGKPLSPETIDSLFEPHSRGATAKVKGTGLGLYIVRSIAERWGGKAWGEALVTGNEFGFTVPLAPG